jgi:hypothetical protein
MKYHEYEPHEILGVTFEDLDGNKIYMNQEPK